MSRRRDPDGVQFTTGHDQRISPRSMARELGLLRGVSDKAHQAVSWEQLEDLAVQAYWLNRGRQAGAA